MWLSLLFRFSPNPAKRRLYDAIGYVDAAKEYNTLEGALVDGIQCIQCGRGRAEHVMLAGSHLGLREEVDQPNIECLDEIHTADSIDPTSRNV